MLTLSVPSLDPAFPHPAETRPKAVSAWLGLGRSCLEQQVIEAALKCYQTAAQISNGSPEVMLELAKAKKRLLAMVQPVGANP